MNRKTSKSRSAKASSSSSRLDRYRARRDPKRSPEPRGAVRRTESDREPLFVVQEHGASSHHFDFRLEVDGVLQSWAVPKGPSTNPADKRLAVKVEDHPLEYAEFEGRIPEGAYGAGPVIVWDTGPYRNLRRDDDGEEIPMGRALEEGVAEFWLEGRKLRGGYALIHSEVGGDAKAWLLIKQADEGADARRRPTNTERKSVLSGRTLEEVE